MAVERIEQFKDVLRITLVPSKNFPYNNYFYTDVNAIDLVKQYSWQKGKTSWVTPIIVRINHRAIDERMLYFHREYANQVLGYYPDYIDHINNTEIDNRDCNLNVVTNQQNSINRPSRGYKFDPRKSNKFSVRLKVNGKEKSGGVFSNEFDCLKVVFEKRREFYCYEYNFLLDRHNDLDILDLEAIGQISAEEATYRHVRRYVDDNPWYVYRYGLEEYCKDNHIMIPNFTLDEQGFMIHPITGQRFCPYI